MPKLMFGAMIGAAEHCSATSVTEFERRKMTAVRQELDQEYQAIIGTPAPPQPEPHQSIFQAVLGLDPTDDLMRFSSKLHRVKERDP